MLNEKYRPIYTDEMNLISFSSRIPDCMGKNEELLRLASDSLYAWAKEQGVFDTLGQYQKALFYTNEPK